MNKYMVSIFMIMVPAMIMVEDILVKSKKPKTESVSKLKEQIANDLEELLKLSTRSIKHLTTLIDDIVVDVKQLAGQESGPLTSADKKKLETFRQNVSLIKETLLDLERECCLKA